MRFSHYRDALRQALVASMAEQGRGPQTFATQCQGRLLSATDQAIASAFSVAHPDDANVLGMGLNPNSASIPWAADPNLTNQQAAQVILQRANAGPFRVTQIVADVSERMLTKGMNPGGYTQDAMWTDPETRQGSWRGPVQLATDWITVTKNAESAYARSTGPPNAASGLRSQGTDGHHLRIRTSEH